MSRHMFYGFDPGLMRQELKKIRAASDAYKEAERELVQMLYYAEKNRIFVWIGLKSLTGYCVGALKLGRTQTQRIVTMVRRFEPSQEVRRLTKEDEREMRVQPFLEDLEDEA